MDEAIDKARLGHSQIVLREDFQRVGKMWAAILGLDEVTPHQVGLCMIALKVARHVHRPKRDNLVDICGYAETLDMIEARMH